jgi:glycosyltransferase involved in cell wall biosynthesis
MASCSKVSIVLPTYNGATHIRQSIDSCLGQTYNNAQLIVVDDGSTDETPDIVGSYDDPRISYVKHGRNMGLPVALNAGFANADGDYLTWTSDDNLYTSDAIEKLLSFLKSRSCEFVYSDFYKFYDGNPFDLKILRLPDTPDLRRANYIGPSFLYSKSVRETIGDYDPDTFLAEDYDYWIRVSRKFSMRHFSLPLFYHREHKQSLSALRPCEVKMVDILVRLKNGMLDAEQATSLLVNLASSRYANISGADRSARILLCKKINRLSRDFKARRIRLREIRSVLKEIIVDEDSG